MHWKPAHDKFLFCPKFEISDVIGVGGSSHLIQMVENDPFYIILASTCLISRSERWKLLEQKSKNEQKRFKR